MNLNLRSIFIFVFLLLSQNVHAISFIQITESPWYNPATEVGDLKCGTRSTPNVVDWDGDGDYDILSGSDSVGLCYFEQLTDGSFHLYEDFGGPTISGGDHSMIIQDWNDDEVLDLLVSVGEFRFYENLDTDGLGDGDSFVAAVDLITPTCGSSRSYSTFIDWDGDGLAKDIIVGCSDGDMEYYENDGANNFTLLSSTWLELVADVAASPTATDIEDDGDIDLVIGTFLGYNLLYLNDGTNDKDHPFTTVDTTSLPSDTVALRMTPHFFDWDGDTHLDLLTGMQDGYIALYLNDFDEDGYVDADDCNNDDATVNIAATEICDGIDNNCDGDIDENNTADGTTYYADADEDTFGNPDSTITTCDAAAPTGYVADNTDCDDTAAAANPDGTEVCDELDNDCNGDVDESTATDAPEWYQDADGDGLGNAAVAATSCNAPTDFIAADAANPDCDDTDAALTTDCPAGDDDTTGDDDDTAASSGGCGLQGNDSSHNNFGLGIFFSIFGLLWVVRNKLQFKTRAG